MGKGISKLGRTEKKEGHKRYNSENRRQRNGPHDEKGLPLRKAVTARKQRRGGK